MLKIKRPNQMSNVRPKVFCRDWLPIVESSVMMLFSGGGVGKSFASLRLAMEFTKDTGRKAALWLTEDPEGETKHRYEKLLKEYSSTGREFFESRIMFITDPPIKFTKLRDGNAELTDEFYSVRLDLFDYGMVVIDPLLQFNGCNENDNTHAGVMMGALKEWAAQEQKVIFLLHHASRSDDGIKARGAGEWVNGTRGVYEVARPKNENEESKDYRIFTLTKDNGVSYYFRDENGETKRRLKVFPLWEQEQEDQKTGLVRLSIANHNDAKNPKGFEIVSLPFDAIHLHITKGFCYSPYMFEGGHRKIENNLGSSDILCLDFDDGMTLKEAEEKFKNVKALVITTRSHRKEGNGDRFRVIMKLKSPLSIPAYDHNDFMAALFEHIGHVDPATKDMARFFFASPENALYFYTNSSRDFDWEPLYHKVRKKKVFDEINRKRKQKQVEFNGKEPQNTLPKETMFTRKDGSFVTFSTLRETMAYGEKVIVQCRNGYGHNGGQGPENNPAAFITKADNGNVFYHCSGAKCSHEGTLWCAE